MRNKTVVLILVLASLLFTGCIEVFQYVSITDGQVDVTVKYVVQKAVLELGSSFSGEEVDYADILSEGAEFFAQLEDMQVNMTQINTPLEVGYEIRVQGTFNDIKAISGDELLLFVPEMVDGTYRLMVPGMGYDDSDEMGMGIAFLASLKYRILVDLSGDLSDIQDARLIISDVSDEMDYDVSDVISTSVYGSNMMIEMPMFIPFMSEENIMVELH